MTVIRREQPFAGTWKQPTRYRRYYRDRYRELMVARFLDHCSLISFFALVCSCYDCLYLLQQTVLPMGREERDPMDREERVSCIDKFSIFVDETF
jgi:hypothetical protein